MTYEQQQLWKGIEVFQFDDGEAAFPFAARLARDNGWSKGYTACVISEYRKFAFLAIAAGHPVSPSDQVDQAWHLHLLYTRNYWNRFCKETLGKPLHHGPTKGGGEEKAKFNDWYDRTQESYQSFFGEVPPADIWPEAKIRFGRDIHFQRVNTKRCWVIPKVWVGRLIIALMLIVLASFLAIGWGGSGSVLDKSGPDRTGIVAASFHDGCAKEQQAFFSVRR